MTETIAESDRILIRTWEESDASSYHEVIQDDGLNEFIVFSYKSRDVTHAKEIVLGYTKTHADTGRGVFALILKSTKELMGICAFRALTIDGEARPRSEVMYRLAKKHWGKGYATEIAALLLQYGKRIGASDFIAVVDKKNLVSKKVLQKVGMAYERDVTCNRHPFELFVLK